jgi:hypothetical protein
MRDPNDIKNCPQITQITQNGGETYAMLHS